MHKQVTLWSYCKAYLFVSEWYSWSQGRYSECLEKHIVNTLLPSKQFTEQLMPCFLSSCFGFCVLGCWSRYEGADCYLCITSFLAIVGLGGWDKNQGSRDAPTGRVVIGSYVELRYFSLQPLCLWVNHLEILLYRCLIYQSCCLRKQKVQKLPKFHYFNII